MNIPQVFKLIYPQIFKLIYPQVFKLKYPQVFKLLYTVRETHEDTVTDIVFFV